MINQNKQSTEDLRKLNAALGYYWVSFFHIHLCVNESIVNKRFNEWSPFVQSVFFHEYIHFLQDISTICGLQKIYCLNEYCKYVAEISRKEGSVKVPVVIDNKYNVALNWEIFLSQVGSNILPDKADEFSLCGYERKKYEVKTPHKEKLDNIQQIFLLTNHGEVQFGSCAIKESMAYLLQRKCTEMKYLSPEFPYCAAEKLAQFVCPEVFSNSEENLIALCDASLSTYEPGKAFVYILEQIKEGNFIVNKPEDIIEYVYQLGDKNQNADAAFEQSFKLAEESLKSYIDIEQINVTLYPTIDRMLNMAKKIRKQHLSVFLDLAKCGKILENKLFRTILKSIGSPMISTENGELSHIPSNASNNDELIYFMAIQQILTIFFDGSKTCRLKPFCEKSYMNVDERCNEAPWTRCQDKNLCPVALILRHRKLSNIEVKN